MKKSVGVKKVIPILILALLLVSIVASFSLVSAAPIVTLPGDWNGDGVVNSADAALAPSSATTTPGTTSNVNGIEITKSWWGEINGSFFQDRLKLWETGLDKNTLADSEKMSAIAVTTKYLILILMIILIYSALTWGEFPDNAFLRILLAIITGFMATFLITSKEILTMLISYSALSVGLILFFPIAILGWFTMLSSRKSSPVGIFMQYMAWVFYDIYLFIKSLSLFLLSKYFIVTSTIPQGVTCLGTVDIIKIKEIAYNVCQIKAVPNLVAVFIPRAKAEIGYMMMNFDNTILATMFIGAVAILVLMILGNKYIVRWMDNQATESEVAARKRIISQADARDKINAESMKQEGK